MRKILLILLLAVATPLLASPKYEMRAVWLTTNWGLDWPSAAATDEASRAKQQQELCALLDEVAQMGINTVFFQTRLRGEVFYSSEIEPWSSVASGKVNRSPGYDILSYVIGEVHKRGMECHAWIVTIPAGSVKQVQRQGGRSLPSRRPELCVKLKGEWYLDPGHPATASYISGIVREIAQNYAVDGIHLDYIRYPSENGAFPDATTYGKYAPKGVSKARWRIDNITRIVDSVYHAAKACDETIMVSTAPLGRYASLDDEPNKGWVCLGGASQDPVDWLKRGINDFIAPMMYYKDENFFPYLTDWQQKVGENGFVVAGLGIYRMERNEGNWSLNDIEAQIEATRNEGIGGQAHFRLQQLLDYASLSQLLKTKYYRHPALVPPMRGEATAPIAAVERLRVRATQAGVELSWSPTEGALRYVVYASTTDTLDLDNPAYIIAPYVPTCYYLLPPGNYRKVAITAIDGCRRESEPFVVDLVHD